MSKTGAFVLSPPSGALQLEGARPDDLLILTSHQDQAILVGCGLGTQPCMAISASNVHIRGSLLVPNNTIEQLVVTDGLTTQTNQVVVPSGHVGPVVLLVPPITYVDCVGAGGAYRLDSSIDPGNPGAALLVGSQNGGFLLGVSGPTWTRARLLLRGTWLADTAGLTNQLRLRREDGTQLGAPRVIENTPAQSAGYFFFFTEWFTVDEYAASSWLEVVNDSPAGRTLRICSVHIQFI